MAFESIGDAVKRFLAGTPSLEQIEGAIWGDKMDPRLTPELRQSLEHALIRAKSERQKKAVNR